MALIAALEFGDNNIGRYSKSYLVSDCRFVFTRPYNSYRPEGMARCERLSSSVLPQRPNWMNQMPRSSISRMPSASRSQRNMISTPHGAGI